LFVIPFAFPIFYRLMKHLAWSFGLALCCIDSAPVTAQPAPLRLSLAQAVQMAASESGNSSVLMAENSVRLAEARRAQARSLLLPNLEAGFTEQNLTRNLGAEGFNFPTGVPNFTIPQGVGPFNNYDVRLFLTQNLLDFSSFRRNRGLRAASEAAQADVTTQRDRSAAAVAHDYLAALREEASVASAREAVSLSQELLKVARDREESGNAAALEVTRAQLRLATDRRKAAAAEADLLQARLQLMGDLSVDFETPVELTDRLVYAPEPPPDLARTLAAAFHARSELQASRKREEEARINDSAIGLEKIPSVTAYGDVGPLSSIVTHTVGISVKIPIFDGGRRTARREETAAVVQQAELQQRDLRRQIELQVRTATARLRAAVSDIASCDEALALAQEGLDQARRRFEGGVANNVELVDAQGLLAQSRDNRIAAVFAWSQARVDLADAAASIQSVSMPR
jgi:outer membrane protein TolC